MTQAIDRSIDTPVQPLSIPMGKVSVMTQEGLKTSAYAVGQWVKYGENQIIDASAVFDGKTPNL